MKDRIDGKDPRHSKFATSAQVFNGAVIHCGLSSGVQCEQ